MSREDLHLMLRQLAGSSLSDDDVAALVSEALARAGSPGGLGPDAFRAALAGRDLAAMEVVVPTDLC